MSLLRPCYASVVSFVASSCSPLLSHSTPVIVTAPPPLPWSLSPALGPCHSLGPPVPCHVPPGSPATAPLGVGASLSSHKVPGLRFPGPCHLPCCCHTPQSPSSPPHVPRHLNGFLSPFPRSAVPSCSSVSCPVPSPPRSPSLSPMSLVIAPMSPCSLCSPLAACPRFPPNPMVPPPICPFMLLVLPHISVPPHPHAPPPFMSPRPCATPLCPHGLPLPPPPPQAVSPFPRVPAGQWGGLGPSPPAPGQQEPGRDPPLEPPPLEGLEALALTIDAGGCWGRDTQVSGGGNWGDPGLGGGTQASREGG